MADQQQFANDAFAQAEEASKYLDTPIDLGANNAQYQYSDWIGNQYLSGPDNKQYVFVPESFVNKGNVQDIGDLQGNVRSYQFYNPAFLKSDTFKEASPFTQDGTKGYVWELDDAVDSGVVKGAGDPIIKSYKIDDTNRAIAGIGKPTYAPGEYQGQICYVSQPKQLGSSAAEQNFVSTDGTRYIGSLKYEYVHQGSFWNAVRKVLPTINMLAPVLLDVFVAPGTGAAFGIGQSMGTAAATGDWEKGIVNAAKLYAIQQGSSTIGNIAGQEFANFGDIAKSIVQTGTTNAVTASLMGRDPIQGFISGGISGAVGAAARGIEGFGDLPVPVQKMFAAGVGSALQGKDADQITQATMTAAIRSGLEAMGNAMDASKYFEEKMGREPTTDELNNFTWYTNRNALQTSLDNYSKVAAQAAATNTPLTSEQIRDCLTSPDPVKTAQKYIEEAQAAVAPAPTPAPAPAPTPETAPETTPGTDTGVDMSAYPIQDLGVSPESMQELQEILSDENFRASQWKPDDAGGYTMTGDDGSTLTIDADGSTYFTEATDTPYTPESPTKPAGTKGIRIPIGGGTGKTAPKSTPTGTAGTAGTTATGTTPVEPTPTDRFRKAISELSANELMSLLGLEDQSYTSEGGEAAGEAGAQVEVGGGEDSNINYLDKLAEKPKYFDSEDQGQITGGGEVEPGQDAGAGSKGAVFGPPVGTGGGGASYGPGYVSSGPVNKGGAGVTRTSGGTRSTGVPGTQGEQITMDQIVKMLQSQGGAGQYGSQKDAETMRLLDDLKSAGLEDQSAAETQRLANAYGPIAIGQAPVRQVGTPAKPAAPAAPAATALAPAIAPEISGQPATPATGSSDELIKQLQGYASSAAGQASSMFNSLFAPKKWTPVPGTPFYVDSNGNMGQKFTYTDSSGKTVTTIK